MNKREKLCINEQITAMIKYNLYLDDIRIPWDCMTYQTALMPSDRSIYTKLQWVVVRNYEEFVHEIETRFKEGSVPEIISFDHDLADSHYDPAMYGHDEGYPEEFEEKTGNDCAKWFVQFCIDNNIEMPQVAVHSMNPIGAKRILETLRDLARYQAQNGK